MAVVFVAVIRASAAFNIINHCSKRCYVVPDSAADGGAVYLGPDVE